MRKLSILTMIFGLLVLTACDSDSGNDDTDVSAQFTGGWALGGLSDGDGDRTASFAQGYEGVTITFSQAGSVTLDVNSLDDNFDANYSGTWSVVESSNTLNVSLSVGGQATPLSFTYDFINDDTVALTASSSTGLLLGVLFQTSFAEPVTITVVR